MVKPKKEKLKILFTKQQVHNRVKILAKKINSDYKKEKADSLVVISVLKGAFMFTADLIREIELPVQLEFVKISSYGSQKYSSGKIDAPILLLPNLNGKDVLIVEDVVDTGLTIEYLQRYFSSKNPKSIKLCSLLLKPKSLKQKIQVDYCGFEIGDEFVVGYGMDAAQHYRNLKYLAVLT